MAFIPSYVALHESGKLETRIAHLTALLESCTLCPRQCGVDRVQDQRGICGAGKDLEVSSAFAHFGEEAPLVGQHGSGTIFLTHCNLRCVFCQNYDISHLGEGETISSLGMATCMVALQKKGCHNINFVTPTHFVPQIVSALPAAIEMGLRVPLVYNCGGYESLAVIRLLEGIVNIYMPDAKFADPDVAQKYCNAPDYPEVVKAVLEEMHRQVGVLTVNREGIAERGVLIRHLVMPGGLAGTDALMQFIARELSPDSYVNIMAQYHPQHKAHHYPELNRRITMSEFRETLATARNAGLHRGFPTP
jgi:putative pyruvate formate lyase activating enzyme